MMPTDDPSWKDVQHETWQSVSLTLPGSEHKPCPSLLASTWARHWKNWTAELLTQSWTPQPTPSENSIIHHENLATLRYLSAPTGIPLNSPVQNTQCKSSINHFCHESWTLQKNAHLFGCDGINKNCNCETVFPAKWKTVFADFAMFRFRILN